MNRNIIFAALGGMFGCVARYLSVYALANLFPLTFPIGTFVVNVVGCFVMGAAIGLSERFGWTHSEWRVFVTVGFCGGFTTFSAFAFENVELLRDKYYLTFAAYSISSFVLCLLAAFGGYTASKG